MKKSEKPIWNILFLKSFCRLSVCHVIDLDSDQSLTDQGIVKSTKYYKFQESILYMKRVPYISRKICLMIEASINTINKKKYWRKYHKKIESILNMAESIIRILRVS